MHTVTALASLIALLFHTLVLLQGALNVLAGNIAEFVPAKQVFQVVAALLCLNHFVQSAITILTKGELKHLGFGPCYLQFVIRIAAEVLIRARVRKRHGNKVRG